MKVPFSGVCRILLVSSICFLSTSVARSADTVSVKPDPVSSKDNDSPSIVPATTSTMWTIQPYFNVPRNLHWPSIVPFLNRFKGKTEPPPAAVRLGWSPSTEGPNQLLWKGVYDNFEAMQAQHEFIMNELNDLIAETDLTLNRLEIHGPARDLIGAKDKKLDLAMALSADFFDIEEGFSSHMSSDTDLDRACETSQYFMVKDWEKARPIMTEFVDMTEKEPGCLYSGWSKKGNELRWRETYQDGNALAKHYEDTSPLIEKLIDGPATPVRFEIHGPKEELEKTKDLPKTLTVGFKPEYFMIADDGSEEKLLAYFDEIGNEPLKKKDEL